MSRIPTNLRLYLQWFAQAHTPFALCGIVSILIPLRRLWPDVRDRRVFIVIAAFVVSVWAIYCAWLVFDAWWFSRFLLSSWPFIMLGIGSVAVAAYRRRSRDVRLLTVFSVVALAVFQLDFAIDRNTFTSGNDRRRFVAAARLVRRMTDRNSVIAGLDHSGSIRYYGGRMTMMYTAIADESLDPIVDWLKAHGVRAYLVVEEWEIEEVRHRFAGSLCLRALDGPPVGDRRVAGKDAAVRPHRTALAGSNASCRVSGGHRRDRRPGRAAHARLHQNALMFASDAPALERRDLREQIEVAIAV